MSDVSREPTDATEHQQSSRAATEDGVTAISPRPGPRIQEHPTDCIQAGHEPPELTT